MAEENRVPGLNPFRPGSGKSPLHLAGRHQQIGLLVEQLDALSSGRSARCAVVVGANGSGRSSLITDVLTLVDARGWVTSRADVGIDRPAGSLRESLGRATVDAVRSMLERRPGSTIAGGLARAAGAYFPPCAADLGVPAGRPTDDLMQDTLRFVRDLSVALEEFVGRGLAIVVDDAHGLETTDLDVLLTVASTAATRSAQVMLLIAGSPTIAHHVSSLTTVDQIDVVIVGALDKSEAAEAVIIPASTAGRRLANGVSDRIFSVTGGHPYLVQLLSYLAWEAEHGSELSMEAVNQASSTLLDRYDADVLEPGFRPLDGTMRRFVRAVADPSPGSTSTVTDVMHRIGTATRFGRNDGAAEAAHRTLLRSGLVHSPDGVHLFLGDPEARRYALELLK